MTCGVEDPKNHPYVIAKNEEDPVGKPFHQDAPDIGSPAKAWVGVKAFNAAPDGCSDLLDEFHAQARFPLFILETAVEEDFKTRKGPSHPGGWAHGQEPKGSPCE